MERRSFLGALGLSALWPFAKSQNKMMTDTSFATDGRQVYEIRVYETIWSNQKNVIFDYFEKALIPSLNKFGIENVGVFQAKGGEDPAKIYVLIPYPSFESVAQVQEKLWKDQDFLKASESYNKIDQGNKAFERISSSFMYAFENYPKLTVPTSKDRIFELRIYEGYNEDATVRKVDMFNNGEIDIFLKTKLNPVFFGHSFSGPRLPNLTYMLWFEDYDQRDSNWSDFVSHPEWKEISSLEKYANTVSRIKRVFLEPVSVSQI